jgi:hypothetical protein
VALLKDSTTPVARFIFHFGLDLQPCQLDAGADELIQGSIFLRVLKGYFCSFKAFVRGQR